MHLQLIVADLHADPEEFGATTVANLPRPVGLEAVFRYGDRQPRRLDWRAKLVELAGQPALAALPPAQVAAAALGLPATANPWLAVPVHLTAGIDHLRLHPAGLLRLGAAEAGQLASSFAESFAGTGLALLPLSGGLILTGMTGTAVRTQDPARYLGTDIADAPATGRDAGPLRRLGAEMEMWLHEHPVNHARLRQGRLAINSLWLWGGGAPAAIPPGQVVPLPRVHAHDAYVAGMCRLSGGDSLPVPTELQQLSRHRVSGHGDEMVIVVLSAAAQTAQDVPLTRLDETWFQPAMQELAARTLSRLSIHCGPVGAGVSRAGLRRFWRRPRPWWENFRA